MKYSLIAFDMDGTLLDDRKQIPEDNLTALLKAHRQGAVIVPATGRILSGLPQEIREISDYAITINGGKVVNVRTGECIYKAEMSLELALRIIDCAQSMGLIYDCYQDDWGWMSRDMYDSLHLCLTNPAMCAFARSVRTPVYDLRSYLIEKGAPVQKMQLYFRSVRERLENMERIQKRFPETAATSSLGSNIELNIRDANKGDALAGLCRALGIDLAETAAFGDGSNDLTMIKTAGLGVAMANSCPEVLAAADVITSDNNSAGVAKAIYEYILK